ncbi:MAG: DNA gyrase subunit B [Candidatus Izimaplasma bacterium HR2]|nr:MAG: DNA gyrase subunit B [Candidatus Izimaplasma bacterium HR2]
MEIKKELDNYGINAIRHLEDIEAIRTRPGMYVSSIGAEGVFHIILEVISNAIDEHLNGFGTSIKIKLHKDGSISIEDDGRGMPIGLMEDGTHSLVALLTMLHTGGKFGDSGYNSSGGLNGVGIKATNALSEWLILTINRNGITYQVKFKRGVVQGEVQEIGKNISSGTTLHFLPDNEIFTDAKIDFDSIKRQVEELSYLSKGMRFELENEITNEKIEYLSKNGLIDYVNMLNKDKKLVHKNIFYCEEDIEDATVEIAVQFNTGTNEKVKLYTNNIPNSAGTHLTGFRSSFTKTANDFAKKEKILKDKDSNFTGEDLKEGLTLIINLKMPEPVFDGQTKDKLTDARGRSYVSKISTEALKQYFVNFKTDIVKILEKASLAKKAREAAKKARETVRRKSVVGGAIVLPGKLTDCQNANKGNSEILLVEGDSAAGSIKFARDRKIQAVLPLKGK